MEKICFIASTGGHFEQLMMLKPLMEQHNSFIVTEKTAYSTKVDGVNIYYIKQINRNEKKFIFNMIFNIISTYKIFLKEKPSVVISTGALATVPMCLISKIHGKKLIFIESFAKIKSPTITGRLMYKFADRFYVQWEEMLKIYPKATYKGGIY